MKFKKFSLLIATVASVASLIGLANAAASVTTYPSKVTIKGNPAFRGRVTSPNAACMRKRTVQVRDASNNGVYDSTTTKNDGRWKLLSSPGIHGDFYAHVTPRTLPSGSLCRGARSATQVHLP